MTSISTPISIETVRALPKVLLHDHLDGGLRASTLLELASEVQWKLPADNAADLQSWFTDRHDASGSLEHYLVGFRHTVAVMQTRAALTRVATECAIDLADDGVVYAEVRFAPELHTEKGLSLDDVVEAVVDGFAAGCDGRPLRVGTICSAIRTNSAADEVASLALRWRDRGVVGFDLAGAEDGFPPSKHLDAFERVRQANFHCTIHAGEGFGLPSIWEAVQVCGGERLGHGVRLVDDITFDGDGKPVLGRLAAFVRDRRIALEMCPTSNVHTGVTPTMATHPIRLLADMRFRVTVNTDNRLMSDITLSGEFVSLSEAFGYGFDDFQRFTINAAKSSFMGYDEWIRLIDVTIIPGFATVKAQHLS